jgi:DNA-binding SARP family transcriptional activator
MDVFWPELGPDAAANNLQGVVFKLRRWLEPGLRRGRDSRYLLTEAEGYRFATDGCRVDLDDFGQAVQAGQAALRADDLPAARAALERARDLYRSELLTDMPYAEWAFPARERLREIHLEVLEVLGEVYLRLGAYDETLAAGRQARAVDPLREAFVRQELQARAALGERAEALAAFDSFARLLNEELGLEPSEETRAVREAILAGTIESVPRTAPAPSVELPLVGRDEVLARLKAIWEEGGGVVLLGGEAGLGKTRLLAELAATLDVPVFWSQARAGDPPFAAVLRLFEEHLRSEPPASELEELGPLGAPLAQRVPTLRLLWPDCPPYAPLAGEAEQQRLRQAALAALRLAASRPTVMVLDDLHWADETSLAVLADASWPAGVLVVGAYRSEESARPLPADHELELAPLSSAEVLEAVRSVVGLADPLALSRRLHEVTGGHPLFLTETLRGLLDAGRVYRDAEGAWHSTADFGDVPLTPTLREAVLARADALAPFEREVLDAGAVLRPHLTTALLKAILHTEPGAALETLAARRWLVPSGPDGWEFGHHLTGEALYSALAPPHRRLLHRLAAGALTASPQPDPAEVVTHLAQGGGAAESLAQWATMAGQRSTEQLSYRQAVTYFELAEAELVSIPDGDEKDRLALSIYEGMGTAQRQIGLSKPALQSLERALSLASTAADRGRLLIAQAAVCGGDTGEYDRAMALLAEAEPLLARSREGGAGLAEVHAIQANVLYWRGEHRESERLARQAVAEAAGTPGEPRALTALANALQRLGRLEEAVAADHRMLEIAEKAGDAHGLAVGLSALSSGLQAMGQLEESQEAKERAAAIFERLGDVRRLSIVVTNHGIQAGDLGDLDGSESDLRRAIELAERVSAPYTVAVARHHLGKTLTLRGRLEEAGVALEAAMEEARAIDAKVIEAQARLNLALWCWAQRDLDGANAEARLTVAAGDEHGDNFCQREGRLVLGMVALAVGDLDGAESHAREAHELAGGAGQVLAVGRAERLLGQVAVAREELEAASAHFGESEAIFRRSGAQIDLGQTLLARGAALGDVEAALEARRLFRRAKARPLLREAERLLELSPS